MLDQGDKQYHLEIYEPGSMDDLYGVFSSDSPFMTISEGDLINPGAWDGSVVPGTTMLQVIKVEHIIWDSQGTAKHKLCVFTRAVRDTKQLRTQGIVEPTD